MSEDTLRLVLVEGQTLVAEALELALVTQPRLEVGATVHTLADGLEAIERVRPDVVLLGSWLPDADGLTATTRILRRAPSTNVVIMADFPSLDVLARAVEAGAVGFVDRTRRLDELAVAIRQASAGSLALEPCLVRDVAAYIRERTAVDGGSLTGREDEVLQLLASGRGPAEIADALTVTVHTARNHVRSVRRKLGARTQLEAVAIAYRTGRVRPTGKF